MFYHSLFLYLVISLLFDFPYYYCVQKPNVLYCAFKHTMTLSNIFKSNLEHIAGNAGTFPESGTVGVATGRGFMFGVQFPPRVWTREGRAKISATLCDPTWVDLLLGIMQGTA